MLVPVTVVQPVITLAAVKSASIVPNPFGKPATPVTAAVGAVQAVPSATKPVIVPLVVPGV